MIQNYVKVHKTAVSTSNVNNIRAFVVSPSPNAQIEWP